MVLSEDQGNFKFGKTALPDEAKQAIDQMPKGESTEGDKTPGGEKQPSEPKAPKDDDDLKIVEAYQQWQQDMGRVYGMAEVIVAKQRHGSTGKVRLKFDSRITKFSDAADEGYLPEMRG